MHIGRGGVYSPSMHLGRQVWTGGLGWECLDRGYVNGVLCGPVWVICRSSGIE